MTLGNDLSKETDFRRLRSSADLLVSRDRLKNRLYSRELLRLQVPTIRNYRSRCAAAKGVEHIVITDAVISAVIDERRFSGNHITETRRPGL